MTLFGADLFYADLSANYILSIAGQKGSGKTAMAFEIARWYLRRGYKLITNIDNIWSDADCEQKIETNPEYLKHSVIILDEGGRYLREWKFFEDLFEYARKFDNIILIPSTRIAHENLSEFICRPNLWLQRILPGKLNYWSYQIKTGDHDIIGSFWYKPGETIGVYDTFDVSRSPVYIIKAFSALIQSEAAKRGRSPDTVFSLVMGTETDGQSALLFNQAKTARALLSLSSKKR